MNDREERAVDREIDQYEKEIARLTAEVERLEWTVKRVQLHRDDLDAEIASLQAVVEAACGKCQNIISRYEHSKYILDGERQTALDVASEIFRALDGEP